MERPKLIDGKYLTRETVVEEYKALVYKCANRLSRDDYHLRQDLLQEGFIGLIYAFDRYDITTGNRFMTYAFAYINGYMMRQHDKRDVVHIPANIIRAAWKIERSDMWNSKEDEIVRELKLTKNEVVGARIYFENRYAASFDKSNNPDSVNEFDTLHNILGFVEDYSYLSINEEMQSLTNREKQVLNLVVIGYKKSEISKIMGYSKTWAGLEIRRIREKLESYKEEMLC